jgi:hypothetical protein
VIMCGFLFHVFLFSFSLSSKPSHNLKKGMIKSHGCWRSCLLVCLGSVAALRISGMSSLSGGGNEAISRPQTCEMEERRGAGS